MKIFFKKGFANTLIKWTNEYGKTYGYEIKIMKYNN